MGFQDLWIFTVETYIPAPVVRDGSLKLLLRAKEQVSNRWPHERFVRHVPFQRLRLGTYTGVERDVDRRLLGEKLFRGILFIIDWSDWVIRHVRNMNHTAVNCSVGVGYKVFLVALRAADIFAGMNMQIAEPGEDDAPVCREIASSLYRANVFDQTRRSIDFDRAFELAIVVGDPAFEAKRFRTCHQIAIAFVWYGVEGGIAEQTQVVLINFLKHERKQFRSFRPMGSTPAFGRAVRAFGPAFCGLAEARPFRFLPQQGACTLPARI